MRCNDFLIGSCLLLSCGACAQGDSSADPPALMKHAPVMGGELEYEVQGEGEPVLLIHGTLVAGSFVPVMNEPALANYRLIRYHRRGYAGSTAPADKSNTVQVADAVALLRHLGINRAHVVGHSSGGQIALRLTLDTPDLVHSLAVLEPSGVGPVPGESELVREALEPAGERFRAGTRPPPWICSCEPWLARVGERKSPARSLADRSRLSGTRRRTSADRHRPDHATSIRSKWRGSRSRSSPWAGAKRFPSLGRRGSYSISGYRRQRINSYAA